MCVASGSALSIATFGLFPLAGLDVSPVANKPAAQSQVAILKVFRAVQLLCVQWLLAQLSCCTLLAILLQA